MNRAEKSRAELEQCRKERERKRCVPAGQGFPCSRHPVGQLPCGSINRRDRLSIRRYLWLAGWLAGLDVRVYNAYAGRAPAYPCTVPIQIVPSATEAQTILHVRWEGKGAASAVFCEPVATGQTSGEPICFTSLCISRPGLSSAGQSMTVCKYWANPSSVGEPFMPEDHS